MGSDDLQRDVRELRKQVESLREALADVARPYREVARYFEQFQSVTRSYFRLLDLFARYGAISPDLVVPELNDDISRHIVSALFEKGDQNISQITDAVKRKRGTASRRIVRARLGDLEARSVVVSTAGRKGRTFRMSEAALAKWSQVLGLPKYEGQREEATEGGEPHER